MGHVNEPVMTCQGAQGSLQHQFGGTRRPLAFAFHLLRSLEETANVDENARQFGTHGIERRMNTLAAISGGIAFARLRSRRNLHQQASHAHAADFGATGPFAGRDSVKDPVEPVLLRRTGASRRTDHRHIPQAAEDEDTLPREPLPTEPTVTNPFQYKLPGEDCSAKARPRGWCRRKRGPLSPGEALPPPACPPQNEKGGSARRGTALRMVSGRKCRPRSLYRR